VTTKTERAIAIRDHVLPLLQANGTMQAVGPMSVLMWHAEPWRAIYRTPFQRMPDKDPALTRQMGKQPLPYGLDVWHGSKVFSIEWSDPDVRIITFKRGPWEDALLQGK
jgi:hypothetical protein